MPPPLSIGEGFPAPPPPPHSSPPIHAPPARKPLLSDPYGDAVRSGFVEWLQQRGLPEQPTTLPTALPARKIFNYSPSRCIPLYCAFNIVVSSAAPGSPQFLNMSMAGDPLLHPSPSATSPFLHPPRPRSTPPPLPWAPCAEVRGEGGVGPRGQPAPAVRRHRHQGPPRPRHHPRLRPPGPGPQCPEISPHSVENVCS